MHTEGIITMPLKNRIKEKCSSCGNEHVYFEETDGWQRFSVYYYNHGENECSAYERFNACSFDCYLNLVKRSVEVLKDSKNGLIDGMDVRFAKKLLEFYNVQ
jgi:hypothetical protein